VRRILRNRLSLALLGVVAAAALGVTLADLQTATDAGTTAVADVDASAVVIAATATGVGSDPETDAGPQAAVDAGTDADRPVTADAASSTPTPPASLLLAHDTVLQPNFFYCGPTAVRNALTVFGQRADLDQLATELGTTASGTPSSFDITRVLNAHLGEGRYRTVEISDQRATPEQVATLRSDVVATVGGGDPVVVNAMGTVTDTEGQVHSYSSGHYLVVVGYEAHGDLVQMSDSADPDGDPEYTLPVADLANWIATRGYAA
jgi:Peptidase_C39 like family